MVWSSAALAGGGVAGAVSDAASSGSKSQSLRTIDGVHKGLPSSLLWPNASWSIALLMSGDAMLLYSVLLMSGDAMLLCSIPPNTHTHTHARAMLLCSVACTHVQSLYLGTQKHRHAPL